MLETLINRAFQSLDYKNSENQNHFEILISLAKYSKKGEDIVEKSE